MQELPELDIYRAMLAERYAGARITACFDYTGQISQQLIEDEVVGKTVWFVERRARHLVFHLDNGKRLIIMLPDGAYIYCPAADEEMEDNISFELQFENRRVCFFGFKQEELQLLSVKQLEEQMKSFGPDPLDQRLTLNRFIDIFAKKRGLLKTVLMNQQLIAGIGSLYSDEIAFAAGIRPDCKAQSLKREQWESVYEAMKSVLRESISFGGSGTKPISQADSFTGGYAERLKVFNREGQSCSRCGGTIVKLAAASRKAYACGDCQSGL